MKTIEKLLSIARQEVGYLEKRSNSQLDSKTANADGYALTDWQLIDGKWYYFEPRAGHPLECALYVTDANGAQGPGAF